MTPPPRRVLIVMLAIACFAVLLIPASHVVSQDDDVEVFLGEDYLDAWAARLERYMNRRYPEIPNSEEQHPCRRLLGGSLDALRTHGDWYWAPVPVGFGGGRWNPNTGHIHLDLASYYDSEAGNPLVDPGNRSHDLWNPLFLRMIHEGWHAHAWDRREAGSEASDAEDCGPHPTNS